MRFLLRILAMVVFGTTALAAAAVPVVPFQAQFQAVAGDRWPDRAAQIKAESGFNPGAMSHVLVRGVWVPCAYGLSQFTPDSWAFAQAQGWVGPNDKPQDVLPAIKANNGYMGRWLEPKVSGHWDRALGAYNAGLGNIQRALREVDRTGMLGSDAWLRALPAVTHDHAAETQGYVAHCIKYRAQIRKGAGLAAN